ncbi:hypothetical protein [uncultured Shewanella sp.]|uniref:hypothetical protein n=1 Tax=uncultured Shewanella sp. TaxID=173975 RepID=UPI00261F321C|nr:hypothetical protein [uncultured Shewanella sp.]
MKRFYGDQILGVKSKEATLLKQSYPIAFYTMVNILIDTQVARDKKRGFLSSAKNMLTILDVPNLKEYDIRWEKVMTEELNYQSLLKSECIFFIFDSKFYILYLYFDKAMAHGIQLGCMTYSLLLKSVIENIKVNAKGLNINTIVCEVYNPNVKKILIDYGFKIESKTVFNYALPATRMLFNIKH